MYPLLLDNPALRMYDLLGLLGYALIIFFFLIKRNRLATWGQTLLLLAVHLMAYTFGGEWLGDFVGRGTEFFGYVAVAALGTVLAVVAVGGQPLHWLDKTVPLYLTLASALKMSCFCSGCCNGYPWVYGLFNQQTGQREFPIQLAEAAVYGLLLWLLMRYQGSPGQRFALFLTGYAGARFAVQFFRVDMPLFSGFHWMSAVFCGVGVVLFAALTLAKPLSAPTKTE